MIKELLNLFFPKICEACSVHLKDNEQLICTMCRHDLPITNFHFEENITVNKILFGRVKLESATALLHFSKKGMVQELLHNLKYRGHEAIGEFFGNWLGEELKTLEDYKAVEVVIPVPLHKIKLRSRGYNQVAKFGKALANALAVDYDDTVLLKSKHTKTQVFKARLKRYDDAETYFKVANTTRLKGKHILLVDDIITTGATIEACAKVLNTIEGVKISVATIAIAE